MNEKEIFEHEAFKNLLKLCVMNNPSLSLIQKQFALEKIDKAANKADWVIEMLRACGYIE